MSIQAMMDAISNAAMETRSLYHMTLGEAVEALQAMPQDSNVLLPGGTSPTNLHSYRGYYSDLAFEEGTDIRKVSSVLLDLEEADGTVFEGYKGGDFVMSKDTPLWISAYGTTGVAVIDLIYEDSDRTVTFITKNVEKY